MSLNAKKTTAGVGSGLPQQENIDVGTYPGRLVQLIDLGMQPNSYKGEQKPPVQKIYTTYELSDEFCKDEEGKELSDKPRWLSESFPFYNLEADKAKSTARYLALDPNREKDGDWTGIIGNPVNITIVHNSKGDKVYDNIGSTSPMRTKDAEKLPELVNPPKVFSMDDPDMDVFNSLPKWLREEITSGLEFKGSALDGLLGGTDVQDDNDWDN